MARLDCVVVLVSFVSHFILSASLYCFAEGKEGGAESKDTEQSEGKSSRKSEVDFILFVFICIYFYVKVGYTVSTVCTVCVLYKLCVLYALYVLYSSVHISCAVLYYASYTVLHIYTHVHTVCWGCMLHC